MSVGLATRGMLRSCCKGAVAPGIISLDAPHMQQTLEVRPRVRSVLGPAAPTILPPTPISAQELRPGVRSADAPAPPSSDPKPAQTSTQELRPKIVKAEEE